MLHDLSWLAEGQLFPPSSEKDRLKRYEDNRKIFDTEMPDFYEQYARRVDRVVGNFSDIISFPIIFNYQRLMSMKMADLVCGEYPTITGENDELTTMLADIQYDTDFNAKMYTTVIDTSRYGDSVWRVFRKNGKNTFTVWEPDQWFPIVSQDGTNTIEKHVLCWQENRGTELEPDWYLVAQIHEVGSYDQRTFKMDRMGGHIHQKIESKRVPTGLPINAVIHVKAFSTTDTVYGFDDYSQVDSILCELMERVAQVSVILDKHADPVLTGPVTMLTVDEKTGRRYLERGKFFATAQGDNAPEYLTWDGQLEASFKQIEFLIDQLYILSEMGSALAGARDSTFQAVSGMAMRFKMITPLAKARRISNALTRNVQILLSAISSHGYAQEVKARDISVSWADGIPNDPRETIEYIKLATGENKIIPLDVAINENLGRTPEEADEWITKIDERTQALAETAAAASANLDPDDPEQKGKKAGPVKGTVESAKGSKMGVANPKSPKNE